MGNRFYFANKVDALQQFGRGILSGAVPSWALWIRLGLMPALAPR